MKCKWIIFVWLTVSIWNIFQFFFFYTKSKFLVFAGKSAIKEFCWNFRRIMCFIRLLSWSVFFMIAYIEMKRWIAYAAYKKLNKRKTCMNDRYQIYEKWKRTSGQMWWDRFLWEFGWAQTHVYLLHHSQWIQIFMNTNNKTAALIWLFYRAA